ncbi:MAG: aminotransferase class I and II [Chloroflexota bacterium]|nr:aminotransferase class I and II [Chloroflexota bacterium]
MTIERLTGVRYVVPLREGGSLPAVVDTADGRAFVVKFLGAGQGKKALVAECLGAGLAQALGLPVPDAAVVSLEDGFGIGEPDPEIQDLLRASVGLNFGLAYLPGALAFDPAADRDLSPELAADIVWFDAFITNIDRTPRNTNLLVWRGRFWLIDHGAAIYFHHAWQGWEKRVQSAFPQIKDHVLLHQAGDLHAADARLRPKLTEDITRAIVACVPDEWLGDEELFASIEEQREAYVSYFDQRLNGPRAWLQEALDAQARGPIPYAPRPTHRVV